MMGDEFSALKGVIKDFDIGELVAFERIERGYCNISYAVETEARGRKERYFLRRYKQGIKKGEVEFEHSVINHLVEHDFELVARVHRARDGMTYVQRFEGDDAPEGVFFAVFDFLPGEDRYSWISPACGQQELVNSAVVLAQFHNAMYGFEPKGQRSEPTITDLLPIIAENVESCVESSKHAVFDAYMLENLGPILGNIRHTTHALCDPACRELVRQVIHCDFHPGNLKFHNDAITGLFDFDWSKIDARCFDVALALTYFCARWPGEQKGGLELAKAAVFLNAYQEVLATAGQARPLSALELEYLPHMISASNLYVLNWTVVDYCSKEVDACEYLTYLKHGVHIIQWLEDKDNWDRLKGVIGGSARAQ